MTGVSLGLSTCRSSESTLEVLEKLRPTTCDTVYYGILSLRGRGFPVRDPDIARTTLACNGNEAQRNKPTHLASSYSSSRSPS